MKKTFRGRNSGGQKKTQKEIRNARGLKDVVAQKSSSKPTPSRGRDTSSQFGRTPRFEEDEAAEERAAADPAPKPRYFMWSAEGPVRTPPTGSASGTASTKSSKSSEGRSDRRADHRTDSRAGNRTESRYEARAKAERSETPTEGQGRGAEGVKAAPVHSRSTLVQKMFRASDRFRAEAEERAPKLESGEPAEKFDFLEEDVAEIIEGHGRKGRKKKAGKKQAQEPTGRKGKAKDQAPVFFDERKAGKRSGKMREAAERTESRFVEGIVKRHPDGFGFVIPQNVQMPDVYIPRQHMTGVMTNDRVRAEVYSSRQADRLFGEIKEIVSRANTRIVGQYLPVDQKYGVIQGEGKGWGADMRITARDSKGAQEGDLVAVEVLTYPGQDSEFTGRVIEIIGDIEEPLNDVKRVVFQAGIPHEFSAAALKDARKYAKTVPEKDIKGRVDLRGRNLITIDGATAKDFDDAIYVEQHEDGFKLWVAIADVSHYVKPGTTLDKEAFERGTSTYFPNFVVPMLPEELSNELCSLKPNVVRLCFCCEMDIDFQGHISSFQFYEAVMESKARVIYGEAQEIIDGRTPPRLKHVAENVRDAANLAKILMAKRFREGSLDLEIPETQVVVDESGESVDIIKSERLFAHRLIEELMLAANICTARFLDEAEAAGIYRIHEEPFDENIQALQRFLYNFGGNRSMSGGKLQKKITRALQAFEGKPEAQILNILTLRTMQQAKYSANNLGHFGLGFSHYSHFTSPIRRYPDLIAHRQIKSILYGAYKKLRIDEDEMGTAATMLSGCEQRSVKAERLLINIKKSRFIGRFVGEEFDGVISGVAKFGIFVLLRAYDVDGLVKIEELGDDRFIFDQENLRLVGKRTGMSYNIGDPVRIKVVSVDTEAGRTEFRLAGDAERAPVTNSKKNRKDVQKRRKTEDDRRRVRKERVSKRRRKA